MYLGQVPGEAREAFGLDVADQDLRTGSREGARNFQANSVAAGRDQDALSSQ